MRVSSEDRQTLIDKLQQLRKSRVICYVTSTRAGLDAQMAPDVIPVVYRHLQALKTELREDTIDLFIHSNGGAGIVPWRLVTLIREFCKTFNVLVPHLAYSAATLTALGADTVVMHPMGVLGPTDPTITTPYNPRDDRNPMGPPLGIAVEDVTSYFALVRDDIGIHHEDELIQALTALTDKIHPLALGSVKRSTSQSRMLGKSLLSARNHAHLSLSEQQIVEVVERLTSQLYYHGHPINRREARDEIGLPFVVDASSEEESLLWAIYESFEEEMLLSKPFDAASETMKAAAPQGVAAVSAPIANPQNPMQMQFQQPTIVEAELKDLLLAIVESDSRKDVFTQTIKCALIKQPAGYQVSAMPMDRGWSQVTSAGGGSVSRAGRTPEMGTRNGEATGDNSQPEVNIDKP